jgi:hypothetical protein
MERDQVSHVWEAFCTLSDAQETIGTSPPKADALINHAKLHLGAVLDSAPPGLLRAVVVESLREPCNLKQE